MLLPEHPSHVPTVRHRCPFADLKGGQGALVIVLKVARQALNEQSIYANAHGHSQNSVNANAHNCYKHYNKDLTITLTYAAAHAQSTRVITKP